METLVIEPVKHRIPKVEFNPQTGNMTLEGLSRAENALDVYSPVLQWTDEYLLAPSLETTIHMKIKYFNTSSAKCLLELMEKFLSLAGKGKQVIINWYHDPEDDDMIDAGKLFEEVLDAKINFVPEEDE